MIRVFQCVELLANFLNFGDFRRNDDNFLSGQIVMQRSKKFVNKHQVSLSLSLI